MSVRFRSSFIMLTMHVLIGCGGTGGHIYPAIDISDGIKKQFPGAVFLFAGAEEGKEVGLVVAAGYPIKRINIRGFQSKKSLKIYYSLYFF